MFLNPQSVSILEIGVKLILRTDEFRLKSVRLRYSQSILWEERRKHGLFEICSDIYRNADLPKDFTEYIIIPTEKKQGAKECVDFRTTGLIPRAAKMCQRF